MRNLLALVGLIAILAVGYKYRDRIPGPWQKSADPAAAEVSQAAAENAEKKLERMRQSGDTIHLSAVEFTSYLRYRFHDQLANELDAPSVQFTGDTLTLNGRVPTDRLPDVREVRVAREFLPDTSEVKLRGQLRTLGSGRAALKIHSVSFAKVPVPHDVFTNALNRLGRSNEPGLAADEYPFRLPPGVGSARVEAGELVLAPGR
ncbi:hypothetical protein [Longimicrobium sp.]|uniref:hypothetical protein n=1 Tax=Longimicrobium sp. TaxID=2029185 RepID=UPI002C25D4B7|nr:hypothetical protein [Longimicrobium sp.]HSU14314.1 hypothetical protein [Longimicrobium sp.]